ncbi:hypothetical protein [Salipaludibacillus sp. CF4.18]|uniref:hypothetical protein n=1 Tax=Salipaludibacillus sp. CF4.18 TaxID=3373081 RepID=UPI003EE47BFF
MIREPIKPQSDTMTEAYSLLFEIEIKLRNYINWTLMKDYGLQWQYKFGEKKPLVRSNFNELISYFEKYPPLTSCFTPAEIETLSHLTKIRNKVAHMIYISEIEFDILAKCRYIIKCRLK